MTFRQFRCPECRQKTGIEILYGHPTEEAFEAAQRNEFKIGGCCMEIDDPERRLRPPMDDPTPENQP